MSTRTPCVRCNNTQHLPTAFLVECCRCRRAWHHICHVPPVSETEILRRIEADEAQDVANGLEAWTCRRCSKNMVVDKTSVVSETLRIDPAPQPDNGPTLHAQSIISSGSVEYPAGGPSAEDARMNWDLAQDAQSTIRQIDFSRQSFRATKTTKVVKRAPKLAVSGLLHPKQIAFVDPRRPFALESREPKKVPPSRPPLDMKVPTLNKDRPDSMKPHIAGSADSSPSSSAPMSRTSSSSTISTLPPSMGRTSVGRTSKGISRDSSWMSTTSSTVSSSTTAHDPPTSPTLLDASSPRVDSESDSSNSKGLKPDIRALIADLRASGKLDAPPKVDWVLRPDPTFQRIELEQHAVDNVEQDMADMHMEKDDHDLEDMYGTRVTPIAIRPTPDIRSGHSQELHRASNINGRDNSEDEDEVPTSRLVFDWQSLRYADVEKGHRDDVDRMLAHRIERIHLRAQQNEKRSRKEPARYMTAKRKKKREAQNLNISIPDWLYGKDNR